MSMPVLVLFSRSVNLDHRGFTTYLGRIVLIFLIFLCLIATHVQSAFTGLGAPGLTFFSTMVRWTLVFISLAGVFYFSGVITEEKEEMTLGLLKMTGLNPISIIMGKGTSRILGGVLLLLSAFPFTLLAITLGGVSLDQVLAAYCTMVAYLLLVGALALFSSVCCRRTGTAAALTVFWLFLFLALPPVGSAALQGMAGVGWISATGLFDRWLTAFFGWMGGASPFARMSEIMLTGFSEPPIGFQVLADIGIALGFFLLSWGTFDLFTREQKTAAPARGLLFRRTSVLRPLGVGRAWSSALIWKEFHFGTGGTVFLLAKFILITAVLGLIAYFWSLNSPIDADDFGTMMMIMMLSVGYLELLVHSARTFNVEWRYGTLPDIALLPVSPAKIVYHKIAGSLIALVPYAVFFLIGMVLAPERFVEGLYGILSEPYGWLVILELVFLLHLAAYMSLLLKWVGMLAALGIFSVGNQIAGMLFAFSFGGMVGGMVMMFLVVGFFTVLLHCQIMRLIAQRAGE